MSLIYLQQLRAREILGPGGVWYSTMASSRRSRCRLDSHLPLPNEGHQVCGQGGVCDGPATLYSPYGILGEGAYLARRYGWDTFLH